MAKIADPVCGRVAIKQPTVTPMQARADRRLARRSSCATRCGRSTRCTVIRPGIPEERLAFADGAFVAPGDVGIDEAVGPAAGEVVVREPEAAPVVGVVLELDIGRERGACGGARLGRIGLEQHHDLGTEELAGAQDAARLGGVLGRHAIGMRAIGHLCRQRQHLRPECREHGPGRLRGWRAPDRGRRAWPRGRRAWSPPACRRHGRAWSRPAACATRRARAESGCPTARSGRAARSPSPWRRGHRYWRSPSRRRGSTCRRAARPH